MDWYKGVVEQINKLFKDHDKHYKNTKYTRANSVAAYTLLMWMKNHVPSNVPTPNITYHLYTGDVMADWSNNGVDLEIRVDKDSNIKYSVAHFDDDLDDGLYKPLDYTSALCIEELFRDMTKGERIQRKRLTQLFDL